jgi:hypothetical protein
LAASASQGHRSHHGSGGGSGGNSGSGRWFAKPPRTPEEERLWTNQEIHALLRGVQEKEIHQVKFIVLF